MNFNECSIQPQAQGVPLPTAPGSSNRQSRMPSASPKRHTTGHGISRFPSRAPSRSQGRWWRAGECRRASLQAKAQDQPSERLGQHKQIELGPEGSPQPIRPDRHGVVGKDDVIVSTSPPCRPLASAVTTRITTVLPDPACNCDQLSTLGPRWVVRCLRQVGVWTMQSDRWPHP
jgi:hypothetical protein